MGRRTRLATPKQARKAGEVSSKRASWTLPEAVTLLEQGYAIPHVARVSGYSPHALRAEYQRKLGREYRDA